MEKVNYPWLLTRNKIIKLFLLPIYKLETMWQRRKPESGSVKGLKKKKKDIEENGRIKKRPMAFFVQRWNNEDCIYTPPDTHS